MIVALIYLIVAFVVIAFIAWGCDYFAGRAGAPPFVRPAVYLVALLVFALVALRIFGIWV